ncbi:MAG: hypothetical protein IKW35_03415 [Paludibacteraceae bacterium]|nr:hypothetical protein [Paludibacteraceae bacterium]
MKTKSITSAQLAELQNCLQRINDILGLSITISDAHATHRSSACPRKRTTPRVTTATFTYRWLTTHPNHITTLYQYLLRAKWIAADTTPDDFLAIFSGETTNCKIRWISKKTHLVYLFRLLTDRQYISTPKGIGRWMIVGNHFVDTHHCPFAFLNSQRIPVKAQPAIEQLAELLNIANH